jgi:hypothetical protein
VEVRNSISSASVKRMTLNVLLASLMTLIKPKRSRLKKILPLNNNFNSNLMIIKK